MSFLLELIRTSSKTGATASAYASSPGTQLLCQLCQDDITSVRQLR
uniref:Uncharacterized protein n=1 Tax=Siphoviridae sp. ctDwe1 TaxID=2826200 RepID=A0A8S5M5I9_9CAUD|nr:MAG TPA: hypothetical protein [Siphoviridae sp. ctDwe1]